MKLLHLGDLHLGKSVNGFSMIEDQEYMLDRILELIEEEEIDGVMIAGDVYDRAIPNEEAVALLDRFLNRLSLMKTAVYMISGNHDSDERLNFASQLLVSQGINIVAKYGGKLMKKTVFDEHGPLHIYMLPFVKASQVRVFFPDEEIRSYEDAVRLIIEHAQINPADRNVLIAHQFVVDTDGLDPDFSGSEGASVTQVGTVEKVCVDCFDVFDYVALGHIHSSQHIGRKEVRYSGSLLKYSAREANHVKSFPVVTISEKGTVDYQLISIAPLRDMRCIKGPLEELIRPENVVSPEDYIFVTLTDEETINDAMAIIRTYYPNAMSLKYENSHTLEAGQNEITIVKEERSFEDSISDFYQMMYGVPINEEELKIIIDVAKEAGVKHAAD